MNEDRPRWKARAERLAAALRWIAQRDCEREYALACKVRSILAEYCPPCYARAALAAEEDEGR
jgi:hypothetical protein